MRTKSALDSPFSYIRMCWHVDLILEDRTDSLGLMLVQPYFGLNPAGLNWALTILTLLQKYRFIAATKSNSYK